MVAGKVVVEQGGSRWLRVGAYVCAGLLLCLVVVGLFAQNQANLLFLAHPVLMTAGTCMFTHGVMAFRAPLFNRPGLTRRNQAEHGIVQFTGFCFLAGGFAVIAQVKTSFGLTLWPTSAHDWVGLVTLILACLQFFSGLIKVVFRLPTGKPSGVRVHGMHGMFLFVCAMVTIGFGAQRLSDFPLAVLATPTIVFICILAGSLAILTGIRWWYTPYPDTQTSNMEEFMKAFFENADDYQQY